MNNRPISINVQECLLWLTEKSNTEEMIEDHLIQDLLSELSEYADTTDDSIDLLDPNSWGDYQFNKAYDLIWNTIAPRAAHQQRVENLVQTAGHLGKTHVEEARRSARAKIHCIFYRDFNNWALNIMRKRDEARLLKDIQQQQNQQSLRTRKKRVRVDGSARLELFSKWIDSQIDQIDEAENELGEARMKTILLELKRDNKSSSLDNEAKELLFKRTTLQKKNRVVASKHLCDVTPWMEGSIILSFVSQKDGGRPYLMAEITHRNITFPKPQKELANMTAKEKDKYNKQWDGMTITELKNELRKDERKRLLEEEEQVIAKLSDVKTIKPLSDLLKQWMPKQWEIYKRRKGLVMEDEDDNL